MVTEANDVSEAHPFSKFTVLNENSVKAYVQSRPEFSKLLDGPPEQWNAKETGDGNMNYVYVIQSSQNALVVKQALPYIRCIGESWPMTQDRIRIEAGWMTYQRPFCPEHVPLVHGFDKEMASMIMEYLPPPCVTLRGAIFEGHVFPNMATQIAELLSKTLFFSSTLALSSEAFRSKMVKFNNSELCKATEQVIFMDPYYETSANAYLKPELESEAAELRNDRSAKIAIGRLRNLFLSKPQAFIHADFHTGSVMVTQNALHVIDSEFAFYGPMAFDIGKFIGNLFLAYFALDGHITSPKRSEQQQWLLQSVTEIWEGFCTRFLKLWSENSGKGDAFPSALLQSPSGVLESIQEDFMETLFSEVLGFAGTCMIRRIIGIAQVMDFTTIKNRTLRAECSKKALKFARRLLIEMIQPSKFQDIQSVVLFAVKTKAD